ncbi:LysM peptidoglycan-binding domain-containing protein [Fretibacter rubidus]
MEGDTVYSLSRKLCTSIDDIKQMNGLGSDFNIKIGDSLRLPASRC